jgi:uncharacterized protein (TIGR00645 family)
MDRMIERMMLASRWLMAPLYLGLALALLLFLAEFFVELWAVAVALFRREEVHFVLAELTLLDIVLVATLVLVVMLSGFEALARARVGAARSASADWIAGIGAIKVKILSAIVVISAIELLKIFLDVSEVGANTVPWLVALHLTFVVTAVLLAVIERLTEH